MRPIHKCIVVFLAAPMFWLAFGTAAPAGAQHPQAGATPKANPPEANEWQDFNLPQPARTSYIGVYARDVEQADVTREKLPGPDGAYVTDLTQGGPAEKAGIRRGDIILSFDGERVRSAAELERLVRETPIGRAVKAALVREGKRVDVTVTPQAQANAQTFRFDIPAPQFRERPQQPRGPRIIPPFPPSYEFDPGIIPRQWRRPGTALGIGVQDLTPQLRDYFGTKDGALVSSVTAGSPAARAGLKAGDIITEIDGREVQTAQDVRAALSVKSSGDRVKVTIVRDHKTQTLTVTVGE